MKLIILLTLILLITSCSTSLSDQGKTVRVAETKEEVKGMKFLGNVEGSTSQTGLMRLKGYNNAFNAGT